MFIQFIKAPIIHLLGNVSSTRYHRHHHHRRRQSHCSHQTRADSFISFVVMSLSYFFWRVHDPNLQLFRSYIAHFMYYRKTDISNSTHSIFPALFHCYHAFRDRLQINSDSIQSEIFASDSK